MRTRTKFARRWQGWAFLVFGCYLELMVLESMHNGPTAGSPFIWFVTLSLSLGFIALGTATLWRR